MPATEFAKLFDTLNGQLLCTIDTDDNGDPCVKLRGEERYGMEAVSVLSWGNASDASWQAARGFFENFDHAQVEFAADQIASALNSLGGLEDART